jgi:hypothetical protein
MRESHAKCVKMTQAAHREAQKMPPALEIIRPHPITFLLIGLAAFVV